MPLPTANHFSGKFFQIYAAEVLLKGGKVWLYLTFPFITDILLEKDVVKALESRSCVDVLHSKVSHFMCLFLFDRY